MNKEIVMEILKSLLCTAIVMAEEAREIIEYPDGLPAC